MIHCIYEVFRLKKYKYEYNSVFSGRNWNNGETIGSLHRLRFAANNLILWGVEIVLRRSNGSYCPTSWLMSTFCHEVGLSVPSE